MSLVLFAFVFVVIIIIAFPTRPPLRERMVPLTFFDRFFGRNSLLITRSLEKRDEKDPVLYNKFCMDPYRAGRQLEKILTAALEENEICTPLTRLFSQEARKREAQSSEINWEHDQETASDCLAYPRQIRYGGDRASEIANDSMRAWKAFPESLRAELSGLLGRASPAAARFRTLRRSLGFSLPQHQRMNARNPEGASQTMSEDRFVDMVKAVVNNADAMDLNDTWLAMIHYCEGLDRVLKKADAWRYDKRLAQLNSMTGDSWFPEGILYAAQTPFGLVLVGGYGDNIYPAGDAYLILDLGGNDTYFFDERFASSEAGGQPSYCSTVVDLSGDDLYTGGDGCVGAGLLGYKSILDLEGNDRYFASRLGLGAGFMGAGIVVDLDGCDQYKSRSFGLGSGVYGFGILIDGRGDDQYRASSMSQGFAGPFGMGCLVDDSGEDLYICLPSERQADALLPISWNDEKLATSPPVFAQGCSMGLTPDGPGGLGLLIDLGGDDSYRAGRAGQGMARGRGVGLLIDGRGFDYFNGRDQCQGFGEEGGIGIIRDLMGNDHYIAHDHAQGMGAANSLGMLIDDSGDDLYYALENAQGKNKANGTGILFDLKGNDEFLTSQETSWVK